MTEVKVLIAGAGIAGLASAIALGQLDKPNLEFNIQLYDKATGLREIGASIALSPNGLRTLERLGVHSALDHDVAFRGPSALHMIYRHWKTNDIVSVDQFVNVPDTKHQTARFHRAHLHQALLAHVPSENIHLHKAVKSAEVDGDGDGVTLAFEDGTNARGDVFIGADGLRSQGTENVQTGAYTALHGPDMDPVNLRCVAGRKHAGFPCGFDALEGSEVHVLCVAARTKHVLDGRQL